MLSGEMLAYGRGWGDRTTSRKSGAQGVFLNGSWSHLPGPGSQWKVVELLATLFCIRALRTVLLQKQQRYAKEEMLGKAVVTVKVIGGIPVGQQESQSWEGLGRLCSGPETSRAYSAAVTKYHKAVQ